MKLHYRETGSGEPVIILHGLLGSSDNWQTIGKNLAENGLRVIMADLRNHGLSPHDENFTLEAMSEDILELMQELNLEESVITGHSLGGKAAMLFAFKHPGKVKKLIVVDIAPRKYRVHHQDIFEALSSINLASLTARSEVEDQLMNQLNNKGVVQWLMKSLYWKEKDKLDWRFNLPVIKKQLENTGGQITSNNPFPNPAMFIKGEKSDYISFEDEKEIYQLFSDVQIKVAPSAGHWVQAEQPQWLIENMVSFIKS